MSLEEAFKTYTNLVQAVIAASRRDAATTATINQVTYVVIDLKRLVNELEANAEFQTLIKITALNFSKEPYEDTSFGHLLWNQNVKAFFRRSGFYLLAYHGEIQDTDNAFGRYVEAFQQEKVLIRYLVPLEFVDFGDSPIDFGNFRIVQFSRNDLEALLQTKINKMFYPYAYADLSELSSLWFLEVIETVDAWEPGSGGPVGLLGPEVGLSFTDFPSQVEYALKLLALYDWGTYQAPFPAGEHGRQLIAGHDTGWDRFHIPFIISINESQLWSPTALPDLSVVATQPDVGADGEEIGERTVISMYVETDQFKQEMQRVATIMADIERMRSTQWAFLDVALGYLVKAFFASGLDQLLWHMVVVESLLGDKGDSAEGLTKRLQRRAAFVVAQNKQEISDKKKLVRDLYTLRSDMVHGNTKIIDSKVYLGHLRAARELARETSLWLLESLCNLNKQSSEQTIGDKIPSRKEIIAAIDVLSDDELDTDNVKFALDVLHTGQTK
jgi:hypothetical protein